MKLEKVTKAQKRRENRWYDDACGTALAMELVGERWSLLIVRELMFGARRFGQLKAQLTGISANVLTQRLEGLEAAGILKRRRLPPPAAVQVYELTPWGYESEPIMQVMGRWAARSPDHDPTLPLSPASMMMSLRTMLDMDAARDMRMTIAFCMPDDAFVATLAEGRLEISRGDGEADLTLTAEAETLAGLVYAKVPAAELESAGTLEVAGDRTLIAPFVALFELPEKAA